MKSTIEKYLKHCSSHRNLNQKTIKAYRIDLNNFKNFIVSTRRFKKGVKSITKSDVSKYIENLAPFAPRTIRRKIASIKAFFRYLEHEDIIKHSPFRKIRIRLPIPNELPKTIEINTLKALLQSFYDAKRHAKSKVEIIESTRNVLVVEILINSGIRVAELCNIKRSDIDNEDKVIRIKGKGNRARLIPIVNQCLKNALNDHRKLNLAEDGYLFLNRRGNKLSEQSVRNLIRLHTNKLVFSGHITPHQFRHCRLTKKLLISKIN